MTCTNEGQAIGRIAPEAGSVVSTFNPFESRDEHTFDSSSHLPRRSSGRSRGTEARSSVFSQSVALWPMLCGM